MNDQACPECKSRPMEEGFIPDFSQVPGGFLQMAWHRGTPEGKTFLGMSTGIKYDQKEVLKISVYRCMRCGFLKSYARDDT